MNTEYFEEDGDDARISNRPTDQAACSTIFPIGSSGGLTSSGFLPCMYEMPLSASPFHCATVIANSGQASFDLKRRHRTHERLRDLRDLLIACRFSGLTQSMTH